MKKLSWIFSCLVLIGSGLFVHHYAYGDSIDYSTLTPTIGTIKFTGFAVPQVYTITSVPVTQLGTPIVHVTNSATLNAVISNVLPPGTQLYEIKGVNHTNAIAVPWRGKYVEAVRTSS